MPARGAPDTARRESSAALRRLSWMLRREPRGDRPRPVLEQLAIGEDAIGPTRQRLLALLDVVVLAHREHARAGGPGTLDRRERVVRARRQVDDHRIGRGERDVQFGSRLRPRHRRAGAFERSRQAVLPDEVLGKHDDPRRRHGQPMIEAMWAKTSFAETTPVGSPPPSTIGMCRKPPTAILLIATAMGSSWRRTTGSRVMTSRSAR